jgi:hypothetical protein
MLNMFIPNATIPPSAKKSAYIPKTKVILKMAAYGPNSTARKVPPIKCPLVPKSIGKFIICAANTNALEIASRAVIERVYVSCAFFHDHARIPIDRNHIMMAKTSEVLLKINPSDMCIYPLPVTLLNKNVLLSYKSF